MKRVLLIKLTSLGDLIHALPALSDAQSARPGLEFDWVIDESFREIAAWHPAVKGVITTNHREWRGALASAETHGSISKTIEEIRANEYDLVIDGQGNFKTALLSLFSKGPRAGFDSHSVREWIAHLAYQRRYAASKSAHAIERLSCLFAPRWTIRFPPLHPISEFGERDSSSRISIFPGSISCSSTTRAGKRSSGPKRIGRSC